ncbi:hypothetical protein KK449_18395 [Clostridioides difficile]|nr:hypothetical protein [Clostridioides difficile]
MLLLHISTKERSSFYKEFYNDIFRVVGNVNSILDIACGLNPVAYVLSDNFDSRVRYEATDINLDNIELVNKILSLYDCKPKSMEAIFYVIFPMENGMLFFYLKSFHY